MSYSFVKRKLSHPESIQLGKNNEAIQQAILNTTTDLENQVSFHSSYTILVLVCVLIVGVAAIIYFQRS